MPTKIAIWESLLFASSMAKLLVFFGGEGGWEVEVTLESMTSSPTAKKSPALLQVILSSPSLSTCQRSHHGEIIFARLPLATSPDRAELTRSLHQR